MYTILLNILRPLAPYLAAAVILLGGGLYVVVLRHDLQIANQKNAALAADNAANAAAIASYQAQQAKWNAAMDMLDAQTLSTNNAAAAITAKVSQAPHSDDGLVAPVLSETLDSLRALQGTAP